MTTKYDNWSQKQLIEEVRKLNKRKKYGIVWEDTPEQVAEICKENSQSRCHYDTLHCGLN